MTKQLDDFRGLSAHLLKTHPTAPSLTIPQSTASSAELCARELQTYLNRLPASHTP